MNYFRIATLVGLSIAPTPAQTRLPPGIIQGTVVDINGQPVEGVLVIARQQNPQINGVGRQAWTDSAGRFSIPYLAPNQYRLETRKDKDGYANSAFPIQTHIEVPIAEITALSPTATVQIHLGPKAAYITGSVTDASTGQIIASVRLRIWKWTDGADRDAEWLMSGQNGNEYGVLIPPNKEVGLAISAPGYETWTYCGDSGGTTPTPLNLSSAATKTINVRLRPIPK